MSDFPTDPAGTSANTEASEPLPPRQTIISSSEDKRRNREASERNRRRKFRHAPVWIEAACAVALVVITGLYTHYAANQAEFAHDTLNQIIQQSSDIKTSSSAATSAAQAAVIANQQSQSHFIADERPYVWVTNSGQESPKYFFPPTFLLPPNFDKSKAGQIHWTVKYTNYGKSPAFHLLTISKRISTEPNGAFEMSYGFPHKVDDSGVTVPPQKEDEITIVSRPGISSDRFAKLMDMDYGISIDMRILYADSYGTKYETGMCFTKLRSGAIQYCTKGNYIK